MLESCSKSENTLPFCQLMKLTLLLERRPHTVRTIYGMFPCGNLKRTSGWMKEHTHTSVSMWARPPATSVQCYFESLHSFECSTSLTRSHPAQFFGTLPVITINCFPRESGNAVENCKVKWWKIPSGKQEKCSTPAGGWWYTGSWNSTQLVSMCRCLGGGGWGVW